MKRMTTNPPHVAQPIVTPPTVVQMQTRHGTRRITRISAGPQQMRRTTLRAIRMVATTNLRLSRNMYHSIRSKFDGTKLSLETTHVAPQDVR